MPKHKSKVEDDETNHTTLIDQNTTTNTTQVSLGCHRHPHAPRKLHSYIFLKKTPLTMSVTQKNYISIL